MKLFLVVAALVGLSAGEESAVEGAMLVTEAEREVDISTQLPKMATVFQLQNKGPTALPYFLYAIESGIANNVAYANASVVNEKNKLMTELKLTKTTVKGGKAEDLYYRVELSPTPLAGNGILKIRVDVVLFGLLSPHPSHISQQESQFVIFDGNAYVYSPYQIATQKTTIKLQSADQKLSSHTKEPAPVKAEGDKVLYGPYLSLNAFSQAEVRIHYENVAPFLVVNKMTRLIEVSHWGNIAVEEYFEMEHQGAVLKGAFSRLDYQRDEKVRRGKSPSVAAFMTILPAATKDIYYRDEIGNISTSHVRELEEAVEMEIRPRFPLFGGWKTNYYIGYNLPSYEYLYSAGSRFSLKMRFVDHIYDNFIVKDLTVKIILPEGAKDIKLSPPYKVKRSADQLHYTYLDTTGRPVIIAHKSNLVEQHIQDFQLDYTYDRTGMLREPLMAVIAFYLLFLVVIVWVRLDFTISKDPAAESRQKVTGMVEQVVEAHGQRMNAYDAWADAIGKYKTNKDNVGLQSSRKKAEGELKEANQRVGELQAQLKAESPETAEKLTEIQRLEKNIKEHLSSWTQAAERLVAGKLPKAQFGETEKQVQGKYEEARDRMESLVYQL